MAEGRSLTVGEIEIARSIYGDSINYSEVTIFNDKHNPLQPTGRAMAPNGSIYYPPGNASYADDFSTGNLEQKWTFVHEMGHILQHQSGINVTFRGLIDQTKNTFGIDVYDYRDDLAANEPFHEWSIEAQASYFADVWYQREFEAENGYSDPRFPSLSTLTEIAPVRLFPPESECFGPEVPIDMWPLDPDLKPGPDDIYDQDEVRAKVWKKPIELIRVGDLVVSFDDDGNLVPGPVTRTFQNNAKILLNFHGTRVTPGHVYYRPDSKKSYKYETLIDVLRDDGVIEQQDGTLIRAATNVPVDSARDSFVRAVAGRRKTDSTFEETDEGRIRVGTRFLIGGGEERKSFAVADLIERNGGVVGEDELIHVGDGPGVPFTWDFADTLPKPEDFVLACSGTTLEDIYKAAEWESQGPRLPAPMVLDRGPVQPLKGAALSALPRNEPLNVAHAPMASAKPQRTLNRKQRKTMEAKERKAAKARKRLVV